MRKQHVPENDPNGLLNAVREFNSHQGPARIFYNRNSHTFFARLYPNGGDRWFGPMMDGLDVAELYRKTTDFCDVKVTPEELRSMEADIGQYAVW